VKANSSLRCGRVDERQNGVHQLPARQRKRGNSHRLGTRSGSSGRFVENYNVSIESAMLLQAYLAHVIKIATTKFDSGAQDKKSLDQLFQ
jgi:hypothetical protein